MATKTWAILLVIFVTFLTSTGQILYKIGADRIIWEEIMSIVLNYHLMLGVAIYLISAVLLIIAFKGGELSVLYPFIATSYVWVNIFAAIVLNESLNFYKWLGVFVIIIGVSFIGWGSKQ